EDQGSESVRKNPQTTQTRRLTTKTQSAQRTIRMALCNLSVFVSLWLISVCGIFKPTLMVGLLTRLAAAELRGWTFKLALEGAVEGSFGTVADCRRDFGHAVGCCLQHLRAQMQTPLRFSAPWCFTSSGTRAVEYLAPSLRNLRSLRG